MFASDVVDMVISPPFLIFIGVIIIGFFIVKYPSPSYRIARRALVIAIRKTRTSQHVRRVEITSSRTNPGSRWTTYS